MRHLLFYIMLLTGVPLTMGACSPDTPPVDTEISAPPASPEPEPDPEPGNGRYLVLYFSRSGNTMSVANEIRTQTDGTIIEVIPTTPYSSDYNATLSRAQQEISAIDNNGAYPSIHTTVDSFDDYDMVFICVPLWYTRTTPPMQSFLNSHKQKLAGKRLALAVTSSSSGISLVEADARRLCPESSFVGDALWVRASQAGNPQSQVKEWLITTAATSLKLKINVGNRIVTATLRDTPTTRDLLSRLPLDVTLSDYAGAEKIFYPRPALTTEGSPRGNTSARGDIDLYVPWGNIAIFYGGDGGYSNSIIHLGHIDGNGIEALETAGSIAVRIERP